MSFLKVREQLVATLEEALRLQQRLVADARDPAVAAPDLVAQVSVLERLDDRRDELLGALRREASADQRAERPEPSIRKVVLGALGELHWPQNARFLEEYLWATRQLQLPSRAFASLRRDERRAWQRAQGARGAYVAPALNADGSANPRWITNSAWDLERRIVVSGQTERLFDLQKILALTGRSGTDASRPRVRRPEDALLEQYAEQLLEAHPLAPAADAEEAAEWRACVRAQAIEAIDRIRRQDDPSRSQIAARLALLPEGDRVWGKNKASQLAV
jgi:hypothetical protein